MIKIQKQGNKTTKNPNAKQIWGALHKQEGETKNPFNGNPKKGLKKERFHNKMTLKRCRVTA